MKRCAPDQVRRGDAEKKSEIRAFAGMTKRGRAAAPPGLRVSARTSFRLRGLSRVAPLAVRCLGWGCPAVPGGGTVRGMIDKPPVGPAAPPGGDPQAFADAHRELLADRSIQFELPTYEPPQPPQWLEWLGNFFGSEHPVLRLIVYGLAAAIALFLLYLIVRWLVRSEFWRRWRGKADDVEDESWRPEAAPARALLSEADALAARGLFSEAAHLLLFRSIEDIDSRRPDLVRPALTSRDIAALAGDSRAAARRLRPDRDAGRAQPVRAAAAGRAATGATAAPPMRNSPSPTGGAG